MDISTIVVDVLAGIGGVETVLAGIGLALPATNSFGKWCRTASADLKTLLGFSTEVEDVAKTV